jgi:hypothetical protein
VTVEEVMELATCQYVDFPGIGIVDLDAPELPSNDREMLEVVTEQMFAKPSILETVASVTLALRQYENAGGLAPPAVSEAAEAVPGEPAASAESAAVVHVPPPTREGQEASLPRPAEAAASAAAATAVDAAVDVVEEAGPSSPRLVASAADEVLVPDEPAVAPQEHVAPEGTTRVASPEIQEAEENTGAALLQGAGSSEAQTLELACTPWAAASEYGDDAEDDEKVAAFNTLERGLNWARRAFDELILPATSVIFSLENCFFDSLVLSKVQLILALLGADSCGVRSKASPRRAGPARDAACRSPGSGGRSGVERGVGTDVP